MKRANTYKGRLGWQSEFSHRYACWANNHNGWAKAKKSNKRLAKRRLKDELRKELVYSISDEQVVTERNEHKNEKYQDGDIYLNPCFGDLWVVDGTSFIKINNGYAIDLDEPEGFIKVGHIDGVINRRRTNDSQGCPSKSSS